MKHIKRIKQFIAIILFIVLFLVSFRYVTHVFNYKMEENDTVGSFYKEPKDSIEVLFVGSSHAYSSFSPMELWNETGIASYNLGTSSQSIPCSYYLIKEGIRTQHPKVIVLETYGVKYDVYYQSTALHIALDEIPFNKTKIEVLTEFLPRTLESDERLEYYFPIIRFHSRWQELTSADFRARNVFLKGYHLNCSQKKQQEPVRTTKKKEVWAGMMEYFQRIVELCEENDVELVLYNAPMAKSDKYRSVTQKMNAFYEYAEEQGISYINFEDLREELDLDYQTDFRDKEHLNLYGARKITTYLAAYLTEHYDLTDYRDNPKYEQWNKDYDDYINLIKERESKEGNPHG